MEKSLVLSTRYSPICLYGENSFTSTFFIGSNRISKNPDFARVRNDSAHDYPKGMGVKLKGE